MKEITLPVRELTPALAGLSRIVGRGSPLPVLGCVQLKCTTGGSLTLTANNLVQAAVVSLDAEGPGEAGSLLVPLKDLSDVVKRCGRNDTLTISSDQQPGGLIRYPVASAMAEHRFEALPAEEFPPLPDVEGDSRSCRNS